MLQANPVPTEYITHDLLGEKQLHLAVKRLDLIHAHSSGNKFFKLKYNLEKAKSLKKDKILTFGGAFSNHIYATAAAGNAEGLKTIGVIRGEATEPLNPTLSHAKNLGMELFFLDRASYKRKTELDVIQDLQQQFGDFYLIPEGGTNDLAIQGTQEILTAADVDFSHICTAIGTGGTLTGIAKSLNSHQKLLGFSSLKGEFIHDEMAALFKHYKVPEEMNFEILSQYHFGGYAKHKTELIDFLWWFYDNFSIPLDPIYTGKMAFGVWDMIEKNQFPIGSKILMIHTGGLQGNIGFQSQTGIAIPSGEV